MIAVIDLDGTLIDSSKRHYVLMEQLLVKHECVAGFNASEYMEYKADGHSGKSYLMDVLGLTEEEATAISKEWTGHIEDEELLLLDELYEDAIPFLEQIEKNGIKVVYLTARQNAELAKKEARRLGIADKASDIFVVSPASSREGKLNVCRRLMKEDQLIIIGDTGNEEALIRELGVRGYILNRGFRSKKYWDERRVESLASLEDIKAF